jgi:signal peptidase II
MRRRFGVSVSALRPASAPILLFFGLAASVFALDQATKRWAEESLSTGASLPVVKNFFSLTLVYNEGGAFGMFSGMEEPYRHILLLVFPCLAVLAFTGYFLAYERDSQFGGTAFGFIVGGALGNLLDRALHGHVVDFLDAHWYEKMHWPAFNIADSSITVGAGLIVVEYALASRRHAAPPPTKTLKIPHP